MVIPITPNTGEALTMEEMIERAMRSVEAVQSPMDLIVSQEVTDACTIRGSTFNTEMIDTLDDGAATSVQSMPNVGGALPIAASMDVLDEFISGMKERCLQSIVEVNDG